MKVSSEQSMNKVMYINYAVTERCNTLFFMTYNEKFHSTKTELL